MTGHLTGEVQLGEANSGDVTNDVTVPADQTPETDNIIHTHPAAGEIILQEGVELQGDGLIMTLDDIRQLARLGNSLTINDFKKYDCYQMKNDICETRIYPITGGMWRLIINVMYLEGTEIVDFWLEPVGFDFKPMNWMDIRESDIGHYISLVEDYDGTQTQLTNAEESTARDVALNYERAVVGVTVISIERITDVGELKWAVDTGRRIVKFVGFYATVDDGNPPQMIMLALSESGTWEVINEGY
jgi:hypothetical protein